MHGHANTWEEELVEVCHERDALRAELERLRARLEQDGAELDRLASVEARLLAENQRLHTIVLAARNLDAHRDEGYASLVSYLIRLHDALHPRAVTP